MLLSAGNDAQYIPNQRAQHGDVAGIDFLEQEALRILSLLIPMLSPVIPRDPTRNGLESCRLR